MSLENFTLEGNIKLTFRKETVQSIIKKQLDTSIEEHMRQRISFFIAGNLFESPHGVERTLATIFGESFHSDYNVNDLVQINEEPGKITEINPFNKYTYTVERHRYQAHSNKITTGIDTHTGDSIKPINQLEYNKLLAALEAKVKKDEKIT